jgi:hypothetical protein
MSKKLLSKLALAVAFGTLSVTVVLCLLDISRPFMLASLSVFGVSTAFVALAEVMGWDRRLAVVLGLC